PSRRAGVDRVGGTTGRANPPSVRNSQVVVCLLERTHDEPQYWSREDRGSSKIRRSDAAKPREETAVRRDTPLGRGVLKDPDGPLRPQDRSGGESPCGEVAGGVRGCDPCLQGDVESPGRLRGHPG